MWEEDCFIAFCLKEKKIFSKNNPLKSRGGKWLDRHSDTFPDIFAVVSVALLMMSFQENMKFVMKTN